MRIRKFVCCYMLDTRNKCGEPAPEYYYRTYDGAKPLCEKHAEEYKRSGLKIRRWEDKEKQYD